MTARPVVNSQGYVSPLAGIARMPGDDSGMATMKRESVAFDPLAATTPEIPRAVDSQFYAPAVAPPDPLETMFVAFLQACRIKSFKITDLPNNLANLLEIAECGAWNQVVDMAEALTGRADSRPRLAASELILPWRLRLEGMFRLKMFDDLATEAAVLMATEERHAGTERADTEISIAMRLLICETKIMTGRGDEAVEQLFVLKQWLHNLSSGVRTEDSKLHTWILRIQCSIVNAQIRQRQWRLAVIEMNIMRTEISDTLKTLEFGSTQFLHVTCSLIVLECLMARVLLQVGASTACRKFCESASKKYETYVSRLSSSVDLHHVQQLVSDQVEITKGLVLFSSDQYEKAAQHFQNVIEHQRLNSSNQKGAQTSAESFFSATAPAAESVSDDKPLFVGELVPLETNRDMSMANVIITHPFLHADMHISLLSVAVNNLCICSLFMKKVGTAVSSLEALIQENPAKYMVDPIVFNLCTLYDLSCAPDLSVLKKKVLQKVAQHFHVEDPMLHWQSFRLN